MELSLYSRHLLYISEFIVINKVSFLLQMAKNVHKKQRLEQIEGRI